MAHVGSQAHPKTSQGAVEKGRPLRIGLILDSYHVPSWIYDAIGELSQADHTTIALVVMNGTQQHRPELLERALETKRTFLYRMYTGLEAYRCRQDPDAQEERDAESLLTDVLTMRVRPEEERGDRLRQEDIDPIAGQNLDLLVRFGFRLAVADMVCAARVGLLSYHHGGSRSAPGLPVGFWEVFTRSPTTEVSLALYTGEPDSRYVLARSAAATIQGSVRRNQNKIYWKSVALLPRELAKVHRIGVDAFITKLAGYSREPAPPLTTRRLGFPTNRVFLPLLIKHLLCQSYRWALHRAFVHDWRLVYSHAEDLTTSLATFTHLRPPPDRFFADPFPIEEGGRQHIFFEEYLYGEGRGRISVVATDDPALPRTPVVALDEAHHLSWPFIFQWAGEYYMLPEARAKRSIDVYHCVSFPDSWEFHGTLMKDVSAADTVLFPDGEKWWLFTSISSHKGAPTTDDLCVFYSDHPLSSHWIAHPENPVVSDVRKARAAGGIFSRKGALYRPAQDGSRGYGRRLTINRIIVLDEERYEEETVDELVPWEDKRIKGIHTLNFIPGLTVADALVRRWRTPSRTLSGRLRGLRAKG